MSEHEITVREETALDRPTDLLQIIMQVVSDPRMDVEKMERLLSMQERVMADNRRIKFMSALARLQAQLPQITKEGRIVVKGTERSRYARLEDIDAAIRPLLSEYGFSFSFDTESTDGKMFKLSAKLMHEEGHFETKTLMLPLDKSDFRSDVQSIGSTVSYGKRQLIKMHLNLIERDEDTDGNRLDSLTPDQAKDLEALADEVGADKKRFLEYMGAASFEAILARDLRKAITALEAKRNKK